MSEPSSPQSPRRALVLFSGGQDSTVCLAWALSQFDHVETIGFDYGQRHVIELTSRQTVLAEIKRLYPVWSNRLGEDHMVDITGYGAITDTALTQERAIAYDARGLPTTFVPARNLVFFTVASAVADRRDLGVLVGGMCQTDYSGYPDCRMDTLDALERAIQLGLDRPITFATPLMNLSKAQTWALAHTLGGDDLVDLTVKLTHSCYVGDHTHQHPWGYGCGVCPACQLRAKGWSEWRAHP
jgi:7-cyano-7-deazaguanine synthase